jgi:hypothetical protein
LGIQVSQLTPPGHLSLQEEEDLVELTTFTFFWGQQYARACAEMEDVDHRLKVTQENYNAAMERLAKNCPPTEGSYGVIKSKGKGMARATEDDK